MSTPATLRFLKGHGTQNDFVLIPDHDGRLDLSAPLVAALCERRAGIGGDGLLRVVRTAGHPEVGHLAADAEWFMDYRNADGSVAQMCGNGARVFARHLVDEKLVPVGALAIATRGGVRHVEVPVAGDVTVDMGPALLPGPQGIEVATTTGPRPAVNVNMGNPHAVTFVDDLDRAGDLLSAPLVTPAGVYPEGVNVEFVADRGPGHVAMRVHERGSGETRSCGTGACAVMVAAALRDGADPRTTGRDVTYTVDVPGGRLVITWRTDGHVLMSGPAVVLAVGEVDLRALTAARTGVPTATVTAAL